ncbi:uncharacterized protein LOC117342223 isoform X1 [Pecten maximus]|uniref:uncharacterized protein LOC117342223 isoform X1 n=1 Tax=Pecten maximus TaxID=6579 RepID=UPI0014588D9E|nr:uncharacterized protein LOC117342223 isoform X1 [Pecten maximus]
MENTDFSRCRKTAIYHSMKNVLKVSALGNIILLLILLCLKSLLPWADVALPPPTTAYRGAQTETTNVGSGAVCIACSFYGKDFRTTLYDNIITTNSNVTLCCLDNDTFIQDVILELADSPGNQYVYEGQSVHKLNWWTERNYAAHLYADYRSDDRTLTWTTTRHSTSFLRNLKLSTDDKRKLTVPDTAGAGNYFVYSMITFDFLNEAIIKHKQIITHIIHKSNNPLGNYEGRDNWLWHSTFGDEDMSTRQTSYLSGVISLSPSDTIWVEAFSFSRIERDSSAKYIDVSSLYNNFFGMFKLD